MQITFIWDYNTTNDITGFNIYRNSSKICSTTNSVARQLTCEVPFITTASAFTLTSVSTDGTESEPSNLITFDPAGMMTNYRLVTLSWEFNNDTDARGFRMYMNNTPICETLNSQSRSITCLVPETTGAMAFSLTALDQDNNESSISNTIEFHPETLDTSVNISDYDGDGDVDGIDALSAATQPADINLFAQSFGIVK
ncbi:MAG: hypothetical protein MUO63_22755 [Desulfobulbaceae bacterium]|nr:hypothetical protein [Desulfobulbaceae bacterium]